MFERNRVKLFTGIIVQDKREILLNALSILEKTFSKIDHKSYVIPFNYTKYYEDEMGENLLRLWLSFNELIEPDTLPDIKIATISIEKDFSDIDEKRTINLDPGYLELSKVVLASTKDYSHRIYLNKGINAELEYRFSDGNFEPVPWTYADYKDRPAMEFFLKVREIYKNQLKSS